MITEHFCPRQQIISKIQSKLKMHLLFRQVHRVSVPYFIICTGILASKFMTVMYGEQKDTARQLLDTDIAANCEMCDLMPNIRAIICLFFFFCHLLSPLLFHIKLSVANTSTISCSDQYIHKKYHSHLFLKCYFANNNQLFRLRILS